MKSSEATSERTGRAISAAFVLGILGALLIVAGALQPQLSVPGHATAPLLDAGALLADPFALSLDAGLMVVVFALFAVAFCLVGRYRWLMFCAIMIVLFLAAALTRQLTAMLGLTIPQIVDMYNGVLPPDVDPSALLAQVPVLKATTYDDGLLVLGVGLLMIELAPWLRRLRLGGSGGKRPSRWTTVPRHEPQAVKAQPAPAPAPATPVQPAGRQVEATAPRRAADPVAPRSFRPAQAAAPAAPKDLLLDDLYLFAQGIDRPLTFALLDAAGRVTRHRVRLEAAGYLGDTYYLRCRDTDAGNRRDVPAHMLSDIVDGDTGEAIDTDDLLQDLARVAFEAVAADDTDEDEAAPDTVDASSASDEAGDGEPAAPVFSIEVPAAPAEESPTPRGAG